MPFIKYLSPLLLGLAINASAQVFEASGVGDTPEAAKKDAINNAIRFGAGEFVLSKEELNNEDFSQKIISHSNAYIKQVEVRSQVKLPNGSYESMVAVDLENQALLKSLKEMKVAVVENAVDNEALLQALNHFEKNDAVKNKEEDLKELIYELMVKPIEENKEIYRVEILGKLKPLKPEAGSDEFPFELEYQITPMYVDNYKKVLDEIDVDKKTPNASSMNILFFDLSTGKKLPSKDIYVMNDVRELLLSYDLREFYSFTSLRIDLVDKNGTVFKEMQQKSFHSCIFESCYGESIKVFLGTYKSSFKFSLKKDDVLKLKNIRVYLPENTISSNTREYFNNLLFRSKK
ncbi:hypothetical protein JFL47_03990 [Haemophilus haemoglobinophilus]|nr:hypothetical protein [Canicola haemoglobinophilus]